MAIILKTISDSKEAQADLSKLKKSVENIETSVNQTTSSFINLSKAIALGFASFSAIQSFTRYTDELSNINSRLKLVTNSQIEFGFALDSVRKIANSTRSDLSSVANLYQKLSIAGKSFGASQSDIAKATNLISKAIASSGGGAQEANAAIIQLGQALASGKLAGDELRSILENAPPLANAIAKGLNVSIGKLRELGEAGALSSVSVFKAILKQQKDIENSFGKINITYGQALQNLRTSTLILFDEISKAVSGSTGGFANAINDLANRIFKFAINFRLSLLSARTSLALFITEFILSFYDLWDILKETPIKAKESALKFYESWRPVLYSLTRQFLEFSEEILIIGATISTSFLAYFRESNLGTKVITILSETFEKIKNFISNSISTLYDSLPKININKFLPGLDTALNYIKNWAQQAERWFYWLYDKVVGRSWIPDLVKKVTEWLGKLNAKPTSLVASFVEKLNLSFAGIKITAPFIAGILAIKTFQTELTTLLIILAAVGAAIGGIKLLKSNNLNIKTENKENSSLLEKSIEWLKKIQKETKTAFDNSAVGRTIKQILGLPDRTPGQIFNETIDTSPEAKVGRGPYRLYEKELRGFGHDFINAFPRDIQVPLIAGLTGIFSLAIIAAFEAGTTRTVILSIFTSAAAIFAARTVDPKLISEFFGKAAFGFVNILEKGVSAIFSGNVLNDPVGVLSLIAKTALLFEKGREALGKAAVSIGTAPTKLAQASVSIFEKSLLDRDTKKTNEILQTLPRKLNQAFLSNQRQAWATLNTLANLRDSTGNLIGYSRAALAIQSKNARVFGTQQSTLVAAQAIQAQKDLQVASNNLKNLPKLQSDLKESIDESNRKSKLIADNLREQKDAFRAGFSNLAGAAGGTLGGLAGFQLGTEIARGMTNSPEWVKVATAISTSLAGQAVGAGLGNLISVAILAAGAKIGAVIAAGFSLAVAGIGAIIASPILLAIAAALAVSAVIFNLDTIKQGLLIAQKFLTEIWVSKIIPELDNWGSRLVKELKAISGKRLEETTGGIEGTSIAATISTASLVGAIAYFTRNISGLANFIANSGTKFTAVFSNLKVQLEIGIFYLRQFIVQQVPYYFNRFLSLLSGSNFGQAISLILQDIVRQFSNIFNQLRNAAVFIGSSIGLAIPDLIKNMLSNIRANFRGPAIVAIVTGITGAIWALFKDLFDEIRDKLGYGPKLAEPSPLGEIPVATNIKAPPLKKASGGWVKGPGTATSDSIPAMLSNGEFVVNAKDASKNWDILTAINSGYNVSKFKDGTEKTNRKDFSELHEPGLASESFIETLNNSIKNIDLKYLQNLQYYKENKLQYETSLDPSIGFFDFHTPKIIAPYPIGAALKRLAPNAKLPKDSAIFSYATTLHEQGHAWSLGNQLQELMDSRKQSKMSELVAAWTSANLLKDKLNRASISGIANIVIPEEKIASDFANSKSILKGKDQVKFKDFLLTLFKTYTDYFKYNIRDVLQKDFMRHTINKDSKRKTLDWFEGDSKLILNEIQKDYSGSLKIFEKYLQELPLQEVSKLVKVADASKYQIKLLPFENDPLYDQTDDIQSSSFAKFILDSLIGTLKTEIAPIRVNKASGGWIKGPGTATSDSIPAMLSNGEFVVNAKDASKNWDILTAINSGYNVKRFNKGTDELILKAYSDPSRSEDVLIPGSSFISKFSAILESFLNKFKKMDLLKPESLKVASTESPDGPLVSLLRTSQSFDTVSGKISENFGNIANQLKLQGFSKLDVKGLTKIAQETPEDFKRIAELLDNSSKLLNENIGQNKKLGTFIRTQNQKLAEANFAEVSRILAGRRIEGVPSTFKTKPEQKKPTEIKFGEQLAYINKIFPELNLTAKDLLNISDDVREQVFKSAIIVAKQTDQLDDIKIGTLEGQVSPQVALAQRQQIETQRRSFLQISRDLVKPSRAPFEDIKISFEEIGQDISKEAFNLLDDFTLSFIKNITEKIKKSQKLLSDPNITRDAAEFYQLQLNDLLERLRKAIEQGTLKSLKGFEKFKKVLNIPDLDISKRSFTLLTDVERNILEQYASEIKSRENVLNDVSESQRIRLQSEIDEFYELIIKLISRTSKNSRNKLQEAGQAFSSSIEETVTSGISEFLKGKKSGKEVFKDVLNTFTNSIIDTFVKGLMSSVTGENGILTNILKPIGEGIFNIGADIFKSFNQIDFKELFKPFMNAFESLDFSKLFSFVSEGIGKLFKFLFLADGGPVKGPGSGTSDSIPAMLSNGEFVINAKATKENFRLLSAINSGSFRKFAEGGLVSTAIVATPAFANLENNTQSKSTQQIFNISITGDISRQTKAEIYQMLPTIAEGVNLHNREKGYR